MPAPSVKIRPLSPERKLSRGLFEQLAEQIKSGRLAAGARLPTEEELSRAARVSRTVVREAVAALRADGLVVTRQGVGAFVSAAPQQAPFRIDADGMRSIGDMLHVMELRLGVEIESAGLAAHRATKPQLRAITAALEANRSAWGCSTRNGGQAQCASGRLKRSQWIERWGLETALKMHRECVEGMENFKALIEDIDCDPQPGGHLYIAHRDKVMPVLEKEAKLLRETFDYDARILDAATVKREYVDDKEACGAMHEPEGIGIHAGKLAFGYLKKARALGAKVHPASPVARR